MLSGMPRSVSTAIIGAGFGGIAAAAALKRQGQEDFVMLERGDRVGGVWRANTYPGIACDVPSHLYSLSFAPKADWTRRFSPGAEIQAYLEEVVRRLDLGRHLRFQSDVERATFDDSGRWRLELSGGEELEAEVLVTACGQLTRPAIPDISGLASFEGEMFHSAHWPDRSPESLGRVAVLGTGASAIQFVPAVAPRVEHLTVFQRSAPWVIPKSDKPYSARTKRLYKRAPWLQRAIRETWWAGMEGLVPVFTRRPGPLAKAITVPFRAMSALHRAIQLRGNRRLIAATEPDYPLGCKRILITSEWYPTLLRPNVELVTKGIREVVPDAVVTDDGVRHPVDTIIFGTGFTATQFLAPMEVRGRDGTSLNEVWRDGAEAYLGMAVPGFPNFFVLYGPNTNHGTGSALALLEAQAGYVGDAVRMLATGAANRLEVRQEVHDAFRHELDERLHDSVWATCSSWYVTESGRVTNNWPGTQTEYRRRTAHLNPADYLTEAPTPAVV